jgi:hypothetical protein
VGWIQLESVAGSCEHGNGPSCSMEGGIVFAE